MKRFLLDTSAYSSYRRGHDGIFDAIKKAEQIFITPVILGELRVGFVGGSRRAQNEEALATFLNSARTIVLPVDMDTSIFYAEIKHDLRLAGKPISTNDVWIAASGMQHGLPIVTRDAHFQAIQKVIVHKYD